MNNICEQKKHIVKIFTSIQRRDTYESNAISLLSTILRLHSYDGFRKNKKCKFDMHLQHKKL